MILNNQDGNVIVQSVGDFTGYDADIDQSNLSKLYTMLSSPYKDSIGSIVREITSNCFDAHAEINSNAPVIVKIDQDNNGRYISFIDKGPGLSPDRMKNVYSKYLTSTKENSNTQIGYFGIGSKSPLSYTEAFNIITNCDSINYHYIMHKDEIKPRTDLISTKQTQEENGTEIKIYFLHPTDELKFKSAIKTQLMYFDNVYLDIPGIDNDYKVYDGDNFIYRSNQEVHTHLHIALGKVTYPIDFDILGIEPIKLPFALKFNIGELSVISSREDIRYTNDQIKLDNGINNIVKGTKTILKEKIELLRNELLDFYNSREYNDDNIVTYLSHKKDKKYFNIGSEFIVVDKNFINYKELNDYVFTPFNGLDIHIPNNFYFEYACINKIKNAGFYRASIVLHNSFDKIKFVYINGESDKLKNRYISDVMCNEVYVLRKNKIKLYTYKQLLKLDTNNKQNWRQIIDTYQKVIKQQLINIGVCDYENLIVPQSFKDSIAANKVTNNRRIILNEEIKCRKLNYNFPNKDIIIKIKSELDTNIRIIYCKHEDEYKFNYLDYLFNEDEFGKTLIISCKQRMYNKLNKIKNRKLIDAYTFVTDKNNKILNNFRFSNLINSNIGDEKLEKLIDLIELLPTNKKNEIRSSLFKLIKIRKNYNKRNTVENNWDQRNHKLYKDYLAVKDFFTTFTLLNLFSTNYLTNEIKTELKIYINAKINSIKTK